MDSTKRYEIQRYVQCKEAKEWENKPVLICSSPQYPKICPPDDLNAVFYSADDIQALREANSLQTNPVVKLFDETQERRARNLGITVRTLCILQSM